MKVRHAMGLGFALVMGSLTGCAAPAQAPTVNVEAEQAAVKGTLDKFVQAFEAKDSTLVPQIFAHDPDLVGYGTDAAEHWVGYDALSKNIDQEIAAFDNGKIAVSNQTIKVHPSGTVAWFSETTDWDLTTGGKPMHMAGIRLTGVLEKRDGNWQIVQFHGSVPVNGQAAKY